MSPQLPIGTSLIDVEFVDKRGRPFLVKLETQVIVLVEVALAKQAIKRGAVVQAGMIQSVMRPMLQRGKFASVDDLAGGVAAKNIARYEVILADSVAEARANSRPTVNRNDMLDVIVRLGQNEIRLKNAKAMSSGKVGETISVLNTRSNKQLSVTVVNRNLAIATMPGSERIGTGAIDKAHVTAYVPHDNLQRCSNDERAFIDSCHLNRGNLDDFAVCCAELFDRRSVNQIDQYRGYAARHRGDLLTILINESTDVENRDERSLDKTSNSSYSGGFDYGLGGGLSTAAGSASLGESTDSARGFTGDTEFRSERQFTDKFTVTVQDIMPNGNMLVLGRRTISVQGDTRELQLSGIVRQFDVLPNNLVPSHLVANLKIELKAKGAEQAFNNQGWLSKKFNRLWPF